MQTNKSWEGDWTLHCASISWWLVLFRRVRGTHVSCSDRAGMQSNKGEWTGKQIDRVPVSNLESGFCNDKMISEEPSKLNYIKLNVLFPETKLWDWGTHSYRNSVAVTRVINKKGKEFVGPTYICSGFGKNSLKSVTKWTLYCISNVLVIENCMGKQRLSKEQINCSWGMVECLGPQLLGKLRKEDGLGQAGQYSQTLSQKQKQPKDTCNQQYAMKLYSLVYDKYL